VAIWSLFYPDEEVLDGDFYELSTFGCAGAFSVYGAVFYILTTGDCTGESDIGTNYVRACACSF
jgi:hypothetical protein